MKILGIETSCDETGVAIIDANPNPPAGGKKLTILSNIVASSLALHSQTGGIIPNVAAREQVKYMIPVLQESLKKASVEIKDIDAVAVTVGPGLIGSLLVGVETARTLAYALKKPIIPVNHLIGHIYANFVSEIHNFPAIALIVSGGHTDLVLMENHGKIKWLGGTRDDAAGEAFDKIGRLLGIPYPAGAKIEELAKTGNPKAFNFPKPMIYSKDFDFSFSGLKTAVWRETKGLLPTISHEPLAINNICASAQKAIVDVLVAKTIKAAQKYKVKSILLGGGVASNQSLRDQFILNTKYLMPNTAIFVPQKSLCTDNAAMIASAAFFNYKPMDWRKISANPELYFD